MVAPQDARPRIMRMARTFLCRGSSESLRSCGCRAPRNSQGSTFNSVRAGFTLLELLIVIGIIGLLLVLMAPAFTYMKSGADFTNAIYGIQGTLESARTYAKANHTYVFVGFTEVDSSVDRSVSPQVTTGPTPYGRVAVTVVASKDGTRHFQYATSNQGSDWQSNYEDSSKPEYHGRHLVAVGKLQVFENLDFIRWNFGSWTPAAHPNSKMARYQSTAPYTLSGDWSVLTPATPFSWPLGSSLNSGYHYRFDRVMYFDHTCIVRSSSITDADAIAQVMEIDLQPTHGTLVPPDPSNHQDVGNQAVIQ